MRYLLDTHILLWWLGDDSRLSKNIKNIIEDANNFIFISSATIWEMIIKKSSGKLKSPDNLEEVIDKFGFIKLPITISHALTIYKLPKIHKDPFDRMLIAQCHAEDLQIITNDELILQYKLNAIKD